MTYSVPDICDGFMGEISALEPVFLNFGEKKRFSGEIVTIKCFEDNSLVRDVVRGEGQLNVPVRFAGVHFNPGQYLYADKNGIVIAPGKLDLEF